MTSPSKQQTINIYGPGEFGPRQLFAIVHGVETIESEPAAPERRFLQGLQDALLLKFNAVDDDLV